MTSLLSGAVASDVAGASTRATEPCAPVALARAWSFVFPKGLDACVRIILLRCGGTYALLADGL